MLNGLYTLLTPTTTFLKGNLIGEIGEVGVSRVYIKGNVVRAPSPKTPFVETKEKLLCGSFSFVPSYETPCREASKQVLKRDCPYKVSYEKALEDENT